MASRRTGRAPLQHGVLRYLTHDPEHGQPLNQLIGDPDVVPEQWMPEPGLGERTRRRAVQVAPGKHAGSHLSRVAYRGWEFLAHGRGDRVEAVRTALHRVGPTGWSTCMSTTSITPGTASESTVIPGARRWPRSIPCWGRCCAGCRLAPGSTSPLITAWSTPAPS